MDSENSQINSFKIFSLKTKIILWFLLVFTLISMLLFGYFMIALGPVSTVSNIKQIEIKQGEGFSQISKDLEDSGIIRSNLSFSFFSLISGNAHKLKPGQYSLDTSLSSFEILKILIAGPELEREIVIPEGFTFLDIEKKLSDAGIIKPGSLSGFNFDSVKNNYGFLKDLKSPIKIEGYFFPDTYNFFINSYPEDVVKKILDNFNAKAWPFLKDQTIDIGKKTFDQYQILAIASLVEKEAYFDADRPIVSGIIYKRLKIGMPIQIDASIVYAKCGGYIFYCENPLLTKKELTLVSPYNTYLHNILPPTPISNPGLASIDAALHPQSSDYLYYLSDPKTHKIIFSKTLEEQNINRVKYLGL